MHIGLPAGDYKKMATVDNNNLIKGVLIKKLVRHNDERGYFEELIRKTDDFFHEGFGQLSHSYMFSGVIKAWHIHKTQIDWWYCARGDLKVALCDQRKGSATENIINQFMIRLKKDALNIMIRKSVTTGLKPRRLNDSTCHRRRRLYRQQFHYLL